MKTYVLVTVRVVREKDDETPEQAVSTVGWEWDCSMLEGEEFVSAKLDPDQTDHE